jgi:hypothetical protein
MAPHPRGVSRDVSRLATAAIALVALAGACTPATSPSSSPAAEGAEVASAPAPRASSRPLLHPSEVAPFADFAPFSPPPALPPSFAETFRLGLPEARPVETVCNEQPPQEFLKRSSYLWNAQRMETDRADQRAKHKAAVEYRSRQYGFVDGTGDPKWNHLPPSAYARDGRFFGVPIRMNNRVLTALGCVEKVIANDCATTPYAPRVLDGLRSRNTFHNDEVSNHLYGIAIDIDPDKNSCCGCVPPLSEWPRCKKPVSSPFERSFIPRCWVDRFERYGFYWLGYDTLEDTMHFEFLGDPGKILKKRG